MKKNIAVVDDHDLFRKGLVSLLKEFDDINVMIEADNGKNLFTQLKFKEPQAILLDINMPIMDGIETTLLLREKYPHIKIIMLTMHSEEALISHLMEIGANGFLQKNADIEIVIDAIYSVIEKGYYYTENVTRAILNHSSHKSNKTTFHSNVLSDREIEVVKLICKQMTTKEIADSLCLGTRTIDTYRENIFMKTGAKNIVGIVLYAMKHGLLNSSELVI